MAENSWLRDQLEASQQALAACLERAYPLELLWTFMSLFLLGLVLGLWRTYALRGNPAEVFWWDR